MKKNLKAVLLIVACAISGSLYAGYAEEQLEKAVRQKDSQKIQHYLGLVDPNSKIGEIGSYATPLIIALIFENDKLVGELLAKGADPNMQDSSGNIPLHYAAGLRGRANINTLNTLLRNFTGNINHQNRAGQTALLWAANENRADIVRKLLQHGADPTIQDNQGITPFNLATFPDILRLLQNEMDRRKL